MIGGRASRITALGLALVAGIGLWQALKLDRWGFDGPDAGFFPQLVAGVCVLLSLLVALWPGRPSAGEDGEADASDEGGIATPRPFAVYAVALLVLALGSMSVGFTPTTILVTLLIVRFAEGRSWSAAIGYGLACAAVGLVLFGWLLRVDLPEGPIERAFYAAVR